MAEKGGAFVQNGNQSVEPPQRQQEQSSTGSGSIPRRPTRSLADVRADLPDSMREQLEKMDQEPQTRGGHPQRG